MIYHDKAVRGGAPDRCARCAMTDSACVQATYHGQSACCPDCDHQGPRPAALPVSGWVLVYPDHNRPDAEAPHNPTWIPPYHLDAWRSAGWRPLSEPVSPR